MSSKTSVVRLYKDSIEECYFAKCGENEKGLEVLILDGSKAYSFSLNFDTMEELSKQLRVPELRQWASEAFQGTSSSFSFVINDDQELVWKKGRDTKVKVRLGCFKLTEVDFLAAQAEVMNESLCKLCCLQEEHTNLQSRHNTLIQDLKVARSKVLEFEAGKNEVEKELFEQFLPILHSKQDRIKELTKRLAKGEGSGEASTNKDDDDSYGSDTDVDEDAGPPAKKMASLNTSQNFLNI